MSACTCVYVVAEHVVHLYMLIYTRVIVRSITSSVHRIIIYVFVDIVVDYKCLLINKKKLISCKVLNIHTTWYTLFTLYLFFCKRTSMQLFL